MKQIALFITIFLLVLDAVAALLFPTLFWVNTALVAVVVIINGVLNMLVPAVPNTAFQISLYGVLGLLGAVEFVLAFLAPVTLAHNVFVLAILGLMGLQFLMYFVVKLVAGKDY